jgi:hypothetical protein
MPSDVITMASDRDRLTRLDAVAGADLGQGAAHGLILDAGPGPRTLIAWLQRSFFSLTINACRRGAPVDWPLSSPAARDGNKPAGAGHFIR